MKSKMILISALLFLCCAFVLPAEEVPANQELREQLKEALKIGQGMREIERNAIKNDPELKALSEEMKSLNMKMREKLNSKLSDNPEYMELKRKNEEMKKEWKNRRFEGKKNAPPGMEKPGERRRKFE